MTKKILAALVLVMVMACAASADLYYRQNHRVDTDSKYLIHVKSDGTEESTGINLSGGYFAGFRHNGKDYLLVAYEDEDDGFKYTTEISIYDPDNMSAPISSGNISSARIDPSSLAELGSNIVIGGESVGASKIIAVNPTTCEIVDTYTQYTYDRQHMNSYVFNWNGTFIASFQAPDVVRAEDDIDGVTVTMDTFGHITGQMEDFTLESGVEASGGELYTAFGEDFYDPNDVRYNNYEEFHDHFAEDFGIYRISEAIRTMDMTKAVHITHENTQENTVGMFRDGSGGLYYTVYDDSPRDEDTHAEFKARYIYHWNGSTSERVYDAGEYSDIDSIYYDINSGTLYAEVDYENGSEIYDAVYALTPDSSGQFTVSRSYTNTGMMNLTGNPPDSANSSSSGGNGNAELPQNSQSQNSQPEDAPLQTAVISPVTLSDEVLENLVSLIDSIDNASQINYITHANLSQASEPTQSMREYIRNDGYNAAYKLNTVTVEKDGYYVFEVTIPAELVSQDINSVKMYALNNAEFSDSSARSAVLGIINGILNYGELTTLTGEKPKTLLGKMLAVGFLQGSQPFSMFLAKAIVAVLTGGAGGACSLTGAGMLLCLSVVVMVRRMKR